jgi:hypothetical protein
MTLNKELKLIFIAGLGHSGSTLMDLILGAQENMTGLGEVDVFINQEKRETYVNRFDKYPCTCGKVPSECPIWGPFKNTLNENEELSYADLYRSLLNQAGESTNSSVIIDSSKNIHALKSVYESLDEIGIRKENFFVIHLTKDINNYAVSSIRSGKNKISYLKILRDWIKKNRSLERFLNDQNIQSLNIGYEELVLSLSFTLNKILNFAKLNAGSPILDLSKSGSHIISGNNMRLDQAEKIYYDYRWFLNPRTRFWFSLLPNVVKLNRKWVYSNVEVSLEKDSKFEAPK